MNNGIMFGDQGPLMEGTWYNPTTGDSFTVRDSFFEDGQYMVTTTDGRMLGYNMIQNYIKSDKPLNVQKNVNSEDLPDSVINELENQIFINDDIEVINNPLTPSLGNINKPLPYNTPVETPSFNVGIIKKALDKYTRPQVDCSIVWNNFPKKEIQMLNEIMEIDIKEIVEWYASQLDTTEIAIAIHNSIVSYINDQLYRKVDGASGVITSDISSDTLTQTSTVIEDTPKTSTKKAIKKTTKKSTKK